MAKRLASKIDKKILSEIEIKEQGLDKGNFTTSWQGRIFIADPVRSMIAEKIGIKEKGEYAIKVR